MAKKKTKWQKHLMKTWETEKKKNKNATFRDAMKKAAKTFKN